MNGNQEAITIKYIHEMGNWDGWVTILKIGKIGVHLWGVRGGL